MNAFIRPARPEDVPAVVSMIHELAAYERAPEQCHITEEQLHAALFGESPAVYVHVAEVRTESPEAAATSGPTGIRGETELVGFALWFLNFSTWEGVHGIYLEDLYVRPSARGSGIGKALLATLADICVQRGYARLEWWVLHWNPAREFYKAIGAVAMDEWVPYRLSGPALRALADAARDSGDRR